MLKRNETKCKGIIKITRRRRERKKDNLCTSRKRKINCSGHNGGCENIMNVRKIMGLDKMWKE
jgi:hypothetical protein